MSLTGKANISIYKWVECFGKTKTKTEVSEEPAISDICIRKSIKDWYRLYKSRRNLYSIISVLYHSSLKKEYIEIEGGVWLCGYAIKITGKS